MMSKKKKKSKKYSERSSTSIESSSTRESISSEIMNQRFSGQLLKYTNVVKRWQHRWFLLEPNTGMFHYYLSENESRGQSRGGIHLQGALICPSDEDSHTFTVNSSSGEVYKLRATDARARQEWVNKLRSVAEQHSTNISQCITTKDSSGYPLHSGVFVHGKNIHSETTSESFSSAKEYLRNTKQLCTQICNKVELQPSQGPITHFDPTLLMIKSYSRSLVSCLDDCTDILQSTFAADCGFQNSSPTSVTKESRVLQRGTSFVSYVKKG